VGLYSRFIFPSVLDHAMKRAPIAAQRPLALAGATGEVLELGFGTGLNLPHYPPGVRRVVAVEPNAKVSRRAHERIESSPIAVELAGLRCDRDLPFDAGRFDSAVSTWTMCTIPDVARALAEVNRVLKPGGRLFFVEHGLAPDSKTQRWQRRLNPATRFLGDGCHLDRDVAALLRASPLELEHCETFYLPDTPRVGGYTYRGSAVTSS
jgi:SAM-dependent methyltransferase